MVKLEDAVPFPKTGFLKEHCVFWVMSGSTKVFKNNNPKIKQLYTWDSLHGEIEVFSAKSKKHLAVLDVNGAYKKPAVAGRSLDV